MTESDWLTSTDPQAMLSFLRDRGPVSERKLGLFAVACCRRIAHWLEPFTPSLPVDFLASCEEHADTPLDDYRIGVICREAGYRYSVSRGDGAAEHAVHLALRQPLDATECAEFAARAGFDPGQERRAQAELLRDLFGNPFHPASFFPEWRTETVVALARGIYEERAFDRMPALADALEAAGCSDEAVLEHDRGPHTHVRGCWLIDEVLQKV